MHIKTASRRCSRLLVRTEDRALGSFLVMDVWSGCLAVVYRELSLNETRYKHS